MGVCVFLNRNNDERDCLMDEELGHVQCMCNTCVTCVEERLVV